MKNYKKYLPIIAIVIPIIIIGILIFKPTYSIKPSVLDDITIGKVKISDITLEENKGTTTYNATVTALDDVEINYIEIELTGGNEDVTLIGYVGKSLNKGDKSTINASTDADVIDATAIGYEIK